MTTTDGWQRMTNNDRANLDAIMEQTPPELRHRQRLDLLTSWWWREQVKD